MATPLVPESALNIENSDLFLNQPPIVTEKFWVCLSLYLFSYRYVAPKIYDKLKEGVFSIPQMIFVAEKIVQIFSRLLVWAMKRAVYWIIAKYIIRLSNFFIEKLVFQVSGKEIHIGKTVNDYTINFLRYCMISYSSKEWIKSWEESTEWMLCNMYLDRSREELFTYIDNYFDPSQPFPSLPPYIKKEETLSRSQHIVTVISMGITYWSGSEIRDYGLMRAGLELTGKRVIALVPFYLSPLVVIGAAAYGIGGTLVCIYVLDKATHFITGYDSGAWDFAVKNWIDPVRITLNNR